MIPRTSKGWEHGPPYYTRRYRLLGLPMALTGLVGIVANLAGLLVVFRSNWQFLLAVFAWLALTVAVTTAVYVRLRRRIQREFDAAGGRLCTHCGYNLKDLPPRGGCPECGHEFDAEFDAKTWAGAGFVASRPQEPPTPTSKTPTPTSSAVPSDSPAPTPPPG